MEHEQTKQASPDTAPMSGMLNTLLSNPELLQKIGSVIGAMQNPSESNDASTTGQAASESEVRAAQASVATDGLASVLSDPAMLEKLPQIIAVMKPLMGSAAPPVAERMNEKPSPALCRDNLLCALKPFLSPERRDAVDAIIRIAKLSAVFQQLK